MSLARRAASLAPAVSLVALGACAGPCAPEKPAGRAHDAGAAAASAAAPVELDALPLALESATLEPVRSSPLVALPARCVARAPSQRLRVAGPTRLAADPHGLGFVAFAEVGARDAAPARAAALVADADGRVTTARAPWPTAFAPLVARSAGAAWLLATALPSPSTAARIALARGATVELLGEGDGFEPVDLGCSPPAGGDAGATSRHCALLTTRLASVAAPGADLWLGDDAPGTRWTRVPVGEAIDAGHGQPVTLARPPDAEGRGAVVVLANAGELAFWEVSRDVARPVGKLPAPFGLLDAIAAPRPLALTYGARHDEAGCTEDGGRLRFERLGLPTVELRTPTPPVAGWLRALDRGYLAVWLAPLGCGAERRVAFATVLDTEGAPLDPPTAIADASAVAVSARGGEVDLWLSHDAALTWVRARCGAP